MTDARAVRIHEHGGPEVLRVERVPVTEPGPGELLVRMEAFALNHLDIWVRRGIPGVTFPLPIIPGSDGAGVVEALGPGTAGPPRGTRVFVLPGTSCGVCERCLGGEDNLCPVYGIRGESRNGTAREAIVLPAGAVAPAPDRLEPAAAAAFGLSFLTAWNMAVRKAGIVPGQRVLVHAAASGVGVAAIQIARLYGASVAATAGSPEKLDLARRLGADFVIDYRQEDWPKAVRGWAGPRGLDAVLDSVGHATFGPSLRLLAKGGRYVTCGATSGPKMEADFRLVFFKNYEILGSTMGRRGDLLRIAELIQAGRLEPVVDHVFPLDEIESAHRRLEQRRALGKVVVSFT